MFRKWGFTIVLIFAGYFVLAQPTNNAVDTKCENLSPVDPLFAAGIEDLRERREEISAESYKPEVRPFITDDARVVGKRLAQLESWFRRDNESAQQWVMMAYGPSDKLELSIGGVFGTEKDENNRSSFSYALPLLQAKYLFRPYAPSRGPGFGLVAGTFLPAGRGSFKPAGYGSFAFSTISQCFGMEENLLLHLNTGLNYLHINGANDVMAIWGFGTQIKTIGGFHLVGEVFSGDPYVPGAGTAYQTGFRHFFSNLFQVDMTIGKGIAGENPLPFWFSAGVRLVFTKFATRGKE